MTEKKDHRTIALASIFSIPVVWGTTFAVVQAALADSTPTLFVVIRFSVAGLVFALISSSARKGIKYLFTARTREEKIFRRDIIILGLSIGGGYILQTAGLLTTTTSKSAFLTSTAVIWTPLISHLMGREKVTRQLLVAVFVTLIGVLLMTQPYKAEGVSIGDLLTMCCAITFGVYIVWIDRATKNAMAVVNDEHTAALMVTSSQIVAAALLFLVVLPFMETPHIHSTGTFWSAILYTALIGTGATAYLQTRYQGYVSPTAAAVIYMLEPVVAMIIAELFLTERISFLETLGALLIILGVIIAQARKSMS